MEATYTGGSSVELGATIRERAGTTGVNGLFVLAAGGGVADPETLDPILKEVSVPVFGGVFPEILYRGERYTEGAVVAEIPVEPTTTVVENVSDPDTAIRPQLRGKVRSPGETTVFVFFDGLGSNTDTFVQRLFESYGLECTFLGGGAGSLSADQEASLFTNEGMVEDAAVVTTLEVPSSLGVGHGWREVDGPFRVNDADGTTLSMLGDESAFSVYRRVVAEDAGVTLTRDNFFEEAKSYPFGISRLDGEKIVRDPFRVSEDGSITCVGEIPSGEYLHVLTGDLSSLVEAAQSAARSAIEGNDGDGPILAFDCISRVLYLEDDFDDELAAIGDQTAPAIGALTIGEIANSEGGHLQFYNKTVVVAQISEL